MGIRVHWLAEHGVSMTVYSGRITPEVMLRHARTVDTRGAASADHWITYFDDDLDMSEIGLEVMVELKKIVHARAPERASPRRMSAAVVCSSRTNRAYCDLWLGFVRGDPDRPTDFLAVESVKQACDRLGLDEPARLALEAILAGRRRSDAPPEAQSRAVGQAPREAAPWGTVRPGGIA